MNTPKGVFILLIPFKISGGVGLVQDLSVERFASNKDGPFQDYRASLYNAKKVHGS